MPIPFIKYSGCGNDFILVDNRKLQVTPSLQLIKKLCDRQKGVGADGVVLLESPLNSACQYRMRIFNSDGSEAEMCGNGLRCLAQFIRLQEPEIFECHIETRKQPMKVSFKGDLVKVVIPPPSSIITHNFLIENHQLCLHCIDTGVPHAILFVQDLYDSKLFTMAPLIRFHKIFAPKGTNVNFVKILSNRSIAIRTYERGVEQETLACGTGAIAAAIISMQFHQLSHPIAVHNKSNEYITIDFEVSENIIKNIEMIGPAIKIFEGHINFSS